MNNLSKTVKKNAFPICLILILALARLIPHPPNFTPIIAVAIMSGYFFKNVNLQVVNSILEITVIENPIIADVTINGIKSKNLNDLSCVGTINEDFY